MTYSKYIIEKRDLKSATLYAPGGIIFGAIAIYIFLSFYEVYLPGILASSTKYYLVPLALMVLLSYRTVKFKYYHFAIIGWLLFKFASMFWSRNGFNYVIQTQWMSQISMAALFVVLTLVEYERKWAERFILMLEIVSFSVGVLAIFFSAPYVNKAGIVGRNVLYLFGNRNDPNNQAAFLAVGIAIALYYIFSERKYIIFNSLVAVINAFGILQTGSRGGLVTLSAICLVVLFLPSKEDKKIPLIVRIMVFAVIIAITVNIAIKFVNGLSFERLFDINLMLNTGGGGRADIWKNAWELYITGPLFGTGWGSYYGYNGVFDAVHNLYLENLCSTGILGTILLFSPVYEIIKTGIQRKIYIVFPIVVAGLVPCMFLDAANKRFFWNVLFFAMIVVKAAVAEDDPEGRTADRRSVRGYISKYQKKRKSKYIK